MVLVTQLSGLLWGQLGWYRADIPPWNQAWGKLPQGFACEHLEHTKHLGGSPTASLINWAQKAEGGYNGTETRRPGSGEISHGGYTYYWFSMSNGTRLRGTAIGISCQLQPFVVEATPVSAETEWWTKVIMEQLLPIPWSLNLVVLIMDKTSTNW